jgi:hypothetical protein
MTQGDALYVFPAGKTVLIKAPQGELSVQNCFWGNGKNLIYTF